MKAIIVLIESGTAINVLLKDHSKLMLPVANKPLISYLLDTLSFSIIDEVIIVTENTKDEKLIDNILAQRKSFNKNVRWIKTTHMRGFAGAVKDVEVYLNNSPFVVIDGNSFFHCDLNTLLQSVQTDIPVATVCVSHAAKQANNNIYLKVSPDFIINNFSYDFTQDDEMYMTSGIYLFNSEIFKFIDDSGYVDLNEQLLPKLKKNRKKIHCFKFIGFSQIIRTIEDYALVNNYALSHCKSATNNYLKQPSDYIWTGRNVSVNPGASLTGPLIIGDNCIIDDGVHLHGPTCIGEDTHIYENALIRESIILHHSSVKKDTVIEHSIVNSNHVIPPVHKLYSKIYLNGKLDFYDLNISSINGYQSYSLTCDKFLHSLVKYKFYKFSKRILDIIVSAVCMTAFLPLFFIICIAIKLDSRGKVFYIQKRCGLHGKEFKMIKFRTMVENAEKIHSELVEQSNMDGPIFKLYNDPRITRVGWLLRRACIDEVPQFLNVFMGKMSLVGPRPLVSTELRHCPWWKEIRQKVKPGMTGLWQIKVRERHNFQEWLESDLHYVKHQSFLLDLKTLMHTFFTVIRMLING